ncbi:olfactory receptor 14J1-like [Opisthocomus hoazin]|uniref:olfactory receptor 14J1-like n=1 Tax=Opisthocomus hoazin TaxID=30419 RepID=UPI003F52A827
MTNSSSITHFLLLAFADTRELQLLHFCLFLAIYLAALLGNGLIITAIACDHRLHTPMYFFLLNLSFLDLGSVSTTLPKAMANSLWNTRAISYAGCAVQLFFFLFLIVGEYCLLTVMAYDRYMAICKPLHYELMMGSRGKTLKGNTEPCIGIKTGVCFVNYMLSSLWEYGGYIQVCWESVFQQEVRA